MKYSVLFAFLALAACTEPPPPQSARDRMLTTMVYDRIMANAKEYADYTSRKSLVGCIRWPVEGKGLKIRALAAVVEGENTDSGISIGRLEARALNSCSETENSPGEDCTCQVIDRNGENKLAVR